jgi:Flp pilus assembly protein TadG
MRHAPSRQGGAAIVEFAIVAPMVIMLIGVTLAMSLMLWAHMTMQYAVREGLRYAVVDHGVLDANPACQDVIDVIERNSMGMTSLLHPAYAVEVNGSMHRLDPNQPCMVGMFGGRGDLVTVSVSANWPLVAPFLYPLAGGQSAYPFTVAVTMQNEAH